MLLGYLIVVAAFATALLVASCLRLPSLVSTLLAAYLAFVAGAVVIVIVLSPFRAVTGRWVAAAQLILLGAALAAWLVSGRPRPELGGIATAGRELARSPVALLFVGVMTLVLAYNLLVALTTPPQNWDSLTYHLARVAAWAEHGGFSWVPNAPTDRINEFQPLAEQQILYLFTASGSTRLYALPQYLAALASVVAVYGASRRLGFDVRVSACSAALLTTFTLVALEATTAQNDLVAASFPAVAACLLLGRTRREAVLAGAALGIGLGAKLTTALVWPALALLAWPRGRRSLVDVLAGAFAGFVAVGIWGYALNLAHTGHPLGPGLGHDVGASTSVGSVPRTILHVLYRMFDLSVVSNSLLYGLAVAGFVAGIVLGAVRYRQVGPRAAVRRAAAVAIPLAAPLLVFAGAEAFRYLARQTHVSTTDAGFEPVSRGANEDLSAFGPLGTVMLLGTPVLVVAFYALRRADVRHLGLALALPVFLLLLGVTVTYNPFLTRFVLVPAVLTAPLFGFVLRSRTAAAALLVVAAIVGTMTLWDARGRPFESVAGHPWHMNEWQALSYNDDERVGQADEAYEAMVPRNACVGALFGSDEPSYLLWGRNLTRKVFYLPVAGAVDAAYLHNLYYAVISVDSDAAAADQFRDAGWTITTIGRYWYVAKAPHAGNGECD